MNMRKALAMLMIVTMVLTLVPFTFVSANENERVLVVFKDKVDRNLILQQRGEVLREYSNIAAISARVPARAIEALKKNPRISVIEKDVIVKVNQTQDWGIPKTQAPKAWDSGFTGKGIKLAVVDTGIVNHEDLVISGGASFVSYTNSYTDDNGHGTHVAGIIGARNNTIGTVGIAHESNIYAVKVLDSNGSGYISDVIAGIDWSITNKMDIVNLSLGTTTDSSTFKQIVDKAYSQGILVVAAAGNNGTSDGSGDTVNFPARYDSVIAVSATDSNDKRASFSATGNTVEVAAPGVSILSTYLGNKYVRMSGTSMATPYVAGNLALLKQANPSLSHVELRIKLQQGVMDLGIEGKDNWFGYGLIQASIKGEEAPTTNPVQEPIQEPVQEPIQLDIKTVTSVSTDKATYSAGERVTITVQVSDEKGALVSGTEVTVTITPPRGKVITSKGMTNTNGTVSFVMNTNRNTAKGTYNVKADTNKVGYENSSATTSFQIR